MAKVIRIVIHCTSEPADAKRNREYFRKLFFEMYGWRHWGYHVIVYQNGEWEVLQPLPKQTAYGGFIDAASMANGAQGYNQDSLHIAYVGGLSTTTFRYADTRTPQQKETLRVLVSKFKVQYHINEVVGHRDLPGVRKQCPCFDARKEYENV